MKQHYDNNLDIILQILKTMLEASPDSVFVKSLYQQYCDRGGLSKKQLEGLYNKASKFNEISQGKLATLEAIIKKKANRYRSEVSAPVPVVSNDEETGLLIAAILSRYPQHKRVLFFKSRFDNNELLTIGEKEEIKKFAALLLK